jgi:hypothetical protein
MDPAFNQNMDLMVPASYDCDPTLMRTIEEMLAATPVQEYPVPVPDHGMWHDTPVDFDMSMPDAPVYETYHQESQGPITPESSTHHVDQYDNVPTYEQDEIITHDRVKEEQTDETPSDWRSLVDFNIPDYTRVSITQIPQIQALYAAYLDTYENRDETNEKRMRHAKDLSFALLTHYYPASQGYSVSPISPGPIAKTGLSFILAADDGSDIWKDMPAKRTPNKPRKRPYTPRELATMKEKDRIATYIHGANWLCNVDWQHIKPGDIASFFVLRKLQVLNEESGVWEWEWRPHTYLSILIGDFDDKRLSTENTTHRSDILTEALCHGGRVKEGYGMLVYGPRLEFYDFDAGMEWVWSGDDDEEGEAQDVEPKCEVLECGGKEMEMDMRDRDLYALDGAFNSVAGREIVYRD